MSKEDWLAYLQHCELPGSDGDELLNAHEKQAPVSVRRHPLKGKGMFAEYPEVPWCTDACYLPQRPDFTLDPLFHAGAYYVQEASSMSLHSVLNTLIPDRSGLRVLDLCAAPGGKSTLIASWLGGEGLLVANETIQSRALVLADNLSKWGYANTVVSNNDPRQFSRLGGFFDIMVVDAPCSGSGLFRKDPDTMNHWSEENVFHCALRQERILNDAWPALKENGILIYSTCSYSTNENEDIAAKIMALGAEPIEIEAFTKYKHGIVAATTGYRFYPGKVDGEGFYLAVFRKTSAENSVRIQNKVYRATKPAGRLQDWIHSAEVFSQVQTHLGEVLIPSALTTEIGFLAEKVRINRMGLLPGAVLGKDFIPDHDLALSLHAGNQIPSLEFSKEEALLFLKKAPLPHPGKGWFLVKYKSLGLGWVKGVPGRLNNYLPKHFRILKDLPS